VIRDEGSYPKTFHIGFIQEREERVNEINRRSKEDRFDVNPLKRFYGSWTFFSVCRVGLWSRFSADPRLP
jgi:hypothetical protein